MKENNKNMEEIERKCKEAIVEFYNNNCGAEDIPISIQDVYSIWPYVVTNTDNDTKHTIYRFSTFVPDSTIYDCVVNDSDGQIYMDVFKRIGFKSIQN